MSIFVDFAGTNTLVSSSIEGNTISSGRNTEVASISAGDELVGINLHRNGPYGHSSWKQLRVSDNPITRHHIQNSTMTFVVQPGPVRNVLQDGELRVRDRYSALYTFTEPAVTQKSYPLVWNVGRHNRYSSGKINPENPERFSILSSFSNQSIGFTNNRVNDLHNFNPDEEKLEYREIFNLYADGGLDDQSSPLTLWEFLRYRETVFPHMKNQYQKENLVRPNFESFYRHAREDRTKIVENPGPFGSTAGGLNLKQSQWPLDAGENFLTDTKSNPSNINQTNKRENGSGILQSHYSVFHENSYTYVAALTSSNPAVVALASSLMAAFVNPYPVYTRRVTLPNIDSTSNPSGLINRQTSSISDNVLFEGNALWEAGSTRKVKIYDGTYVSSPKQPFYDKYEDYIEEARRRYKNFSIIPEFRMSTQVEDYVTNPESIQLDMFEVTGGVADAQNSSQSKFYQIYSNSDFMRQFKLINEDHKGFSNGKVLSLRCKAVKKFLPYEGFYPCQRTVDLAKRFYDSFGSNIKTENAEGIELSNLNPAKQMIMTPLFAPGVLFNSIKSGVAVDYPIMSGSAMEVNVFGGDKYLINSDFDKRIPFEALIEPADYLSNYKIASNEPHISGNLSASANWTGDGDELYGMMANNFLAETINFFLPSGQLTSLASKKQKDITLETGKTYAMRVKMRRSMNIARGSVYHSASADKPYMPPQDVITQTGSTEPELRETFTMYSRPSSFGPPTRGQNILTKDHDTLLDDATLTLHSFQIPNRYDTSTAGSPGGDTTFTYTLDSRRGYNFPFTPPYYHGEGWCHIIFTATSSSMSIKEIQNQSSYEYTRYDNSFFSVTSSRGLYGISTIGSRGPQGLRNINKNAVQLSASLNLKGVGTLPSLVIPGVGSQGRAVAGSLIVDSGAEIDNRWIIQTKFETPMLNFNHVTSSDGSITYPASAAESVPVGMWHQHGRIPEENEGVFLQVGPIPENYQTQVMGRSSDDIYLNMAEALGFSGLTTKLGRIRPSKKIHEAVVAVPFIEENGNKKFFRIDIGMVNSYRAGGTLRASLTQGDPQNQIGRSVLNQLQKMEKYIFPPSFDFLNGDPLSIDPIAMYIFEFSHTLSQQDLSDIWQNLPPDIGTTMEESEVAITHPLLRKELLGGAGNQSGNTFVDIPDRLKWMVFKVKQRANSNYFMKTVLRNPAIDSANDQPFSPVDGSVQDEFGKNSRIQYNWPYDFFSLVELVKIDSEIEFGNFSQEDINNYTDSIPKYEDTTADIDSLYSFASIDSTPTAQIQYIFEDADEITEDFKHMEQVRASQGEALREASLEASEIEQDELDMAARQVGGELSTMRDIERYQSIVGVDFSSLNNFIDSVPFSAVLEVGIPMDEFRNIANQAAQQVQKIEAAMTRFGPDSVQVLNARAQLELTLQPIQGTNLMNGLLNTLNFNFNFGPGYNQ